MAKEVRKAIMTRLRLRNKFLKIKFQECKQGYDKQRNLCVTMVRKAKKNYFNNLNVGNITDNIQFWKTVKSFFSIKFVANERITLIEEEKVVSKIKENHQVRRLVTGYIYYMEYHKTQYWIHYLLMSFFLIPFCLYQSLT